MSVLVRKWLMASLVLWASYPASAARPPEAVSCQIGLDYQSETIRILEELAAAGVVRLGPSTVQELSQELRRLSFECISTFDKPPGATRFHAFFDLKGKRVLINTEPGMLHPPHLIGLLGLHEFLSIKQYQDEYYELSALIAAYTDATREWQPDSREFFKRTKSVRNLIVNLARRGSSHPPGQQTNPRFWRDLSRANRMLQARSGTLIGGGGDMTSISVKYHLMKMTLDKWVSAQELCPTAIGWLCRYRIESADVFNVEFVADLTAFVPNISLGSPKLFAESIFFHEILNPERKIRCSEAVR